MRNDAGARHAPLIATALVGVVLVSCSGPLVVEDEVTGAIQQEFSNQHSGHPNHEEVTKAGLWFLREDVQNYLALTNANFDAFSVVFLPERHFDDCYFTATSRRIRKAYDAAVAGAMAFPTLTSCSDYEWDHLCSASGNATALDKFAEILHPIQDFYAHTNWVELGPAEVAFPMVPVGDGKFPLLQAYTTLGGLRIVDNPSSGWKVWGPPKGSGYPEIANVRVKHPASGLDEPGLISGRSITTLDSRCPKFKGGTKKISHGELAKDERPDPILEPVRAAAFDTAFALAVAQTTHEWCRFQNLVYQAHGTEGVEFLRRNWVDNVGGAAAACPSLPDEASFQCRPEGSWRCVTVAGPVLCRPENGLADISGTFPSYTLTNEAGESVEAELQTNTLVILNDSGWPDGHFSEDCATIEWNNGTSWVR